MLCVNTQRKFMILLIIDFIIALIYFKWDVMKKFLISDLVEKIEYYHYLSLTYQQLRNFLLIVITLLNISYSFPEQIFSLYSFVLFSLLSIVVFFCYLEKRTEKKLTILMEFLKKRSN